MNEAALIFGSHPSVAALITAGLTVVIVSCIRPLLKWLEFRAYLSLLRELASSDGTRLKYVSDAMMAFRSRGKVGKSICQDEFVRRNSPVRGDDFRANIDSRHPTLDELSWRVARNHAHGDCVQVVLKEDMVVIGKVHKPPYLIYT